MGIVKLTGKGQNRSHGECALAVDGPPLSHLQRRADSKMPFASHSGPLFWGITLNLTMPEERINPLISVGPRVNDGISRFDVQRHVGAK